MQKEAIIHQRKTGINWGTSIFVALFHVGAVAALFMWSWQAFAVAFFLWCVAGMGVGIGYHRLLTHRGFKVPKAVEYFLTLCGTLSLEGGPIYWVVTHRIHHAHTDEPGDPHTPRDGRWWAHVGWILTGTAQQYDKAVLMRYAPDMMKDRGHVWINRLWWVPQVLVGAALFAFGGWSFLLVGVFLRVTFGLHATWLVNSATHLWGTRRFETSDDSRNSWWVALITFGEGWHNNHHAYPTAARHGIAWYEVDFNWWGIRTLQFLGLAKGIKLINLNQPATDASATPVNQLSKAA